jgi:hypothetical protein
VLIFTRLARRLDMKHILAFLFLMAVACSAISTRTSHVKAMNAVEQVLAGLESGWQRSTDTPSEVTVQYAIANEQPPMRDARWKPLKDSEVPNIKLQQRFWVRAVPATPGEDSQWVVYGPLRGENLTVDIVPIGQASTTEVIQFATVGDKQKGLNCCRIRVRVRVVTKKPEITVRKLPDIVMRWRRPIPKITVRGPDIVVTNLPSFSPPDNPLPNTGPLPAKLGVFCEVKDGDARLDLQNGESRAVDIWIMWKGLTTGPIRVEKKTKRRLPKTGYSKCDEAKKNIYITKAEFAG